MKALNFYSSNYHRQLVCRRKICTIRLGDKTNKYSDGDIVWVTVGNRFSPKKRIYTAVIDRVLVKSISQLTQDDLRGENPDLTSVDEILVFLQSIYDKVLTCNDIVTVVYFSEIIE
ncbi:MAG: ASCH domain-containing protein [Sporomusa sp.]